MSEAKKMAKDSAYVVSARVISILSSLMMGIILARLLGKDMYGLVTWAIFLEGIVFIFADLGIQESAARRIAEYRAKDMDVSGSIVTSMALKMIVGLAAVILCLLFSSYIAVSLNNHEEAIISVYACAALLSLDIISTSIYSSLYGFREMTITSYAEVIQNVSKTLLAVVLVVLGFGFKGALIGLIAGSAFLLVFYIYSFKKNVLPEIKHLRLDLTEMNHILTYGFYLGLSWAVVKVYMSFDQFYIGAKLTMGDFVCYTISMSLALLIYYGMFSLRRVLLTSFSGSVSTQNYGMTKDVFRLSIKYIAMIALPAGAGMAALSPDVISAIYGHEYIAAALVLPFLAIMGAIKTCELPAACIIDGGGKAKIGVRIAIVTAIFNVALNLALIPMYGIQGAAVASLISLGSGTIVFLFAASRSYNVRVPVKEILLISLASIIMYATVISVRSMAYSTLGLDIESSISCLTSLALCIPAGVIIYAIAILVFGVISIDDSAKIRKAVGTGLLSKPVIAVLQVSEKTRGMMPFNNIIKS
ncbi:hypothetical protein CUJ83_01745 [Methanocella sp. CWC-04]|uniref:Membrane protein involved in the export of O-antigen and teichoic acid n=1 Tax=Methanooceanicella nereidis TaxID=2052831 RepID=A0AAP2RA37_9EURY|nr:flippase [Methanocella sp. CWC-04]MCD1293718.1 hypothetical protein [Methanocella sp. CWC-04]